MNFKPMLKYCISIVCMLMSLCTLAQAIEETTKDSVLQDSIVYKEKYGLRLGGDVYKLVRTAIDDEYSGFEINGDFRLTKNLYIAGEFGFEEKTTVTDFLNSTANGGYFKAGVDYNFYQNWFGLENMIYGGLRAGFGTFKQTINSYTIYNVNQTYPQTVINESQEFSGLTSIWSELIIGIKAETLNNLYIGVNVQFKGRITETEPDNFENIYIPGFGRTFDSGSFGIGFGYNVSYLIPFYKKNK